MVIRDALPSMMTQKEVAEYLHCSEHHITAMRQHGLLTGTRYGKRWMYLEDDICNLVIKTVGKDFNNFRDMTPESATREFLS